MKVKHSWIAQKIMPNTYHEDKKCIVGIKKPNPGLFLKKIFNVCQK
jgi:hypothetical protein